MSSLARSGTVDRGRAQRFRYLGEDDPSDLDDDDSSNARVTMGQEPPEPPLLELDACGLVVKFTPPSGATLAMILLHAEGGVVRYYSSKTKSFVAVGAGFRIGTGQQQVVAEDGLVEGKVSATICYQSGSTMDLGPESARSNTLELARPTAAPCAPRVKPVLGHGRFMVSFALPALSFKASVKVEGGGNIYHVEPSLRQEVRLNRPCRRARQCL